MTVQAFDQKRAKIMETLTPSKSDLRDILDCDDLEVEWLAGDGSDRSYYRLKASNHEQSYVLMKLCGTDAEALAAGRYDWVTIQKVLQDAGVVTPHPIKSLPDHQALIIEDYGNVTFETCIKTASTAASTKFYDDAAKILVQFLKMPANKNEVWTTRSFDAERLKWELDFFYKHFIQNVLEIDLDHGQLAMFNRDVTALSQFLAPFSKYFCHRDFHSRNLMVKDDILAVIDFQDARLGAAAYDLVSLCFDAYVPLPLEKRKAILNETIEKVAKEVSPQTAGEIHESWPAVFLQRQLKAVGSFGYLSNVKNKPMYLSYVPKALHLLNNTGVYDERWPFLSDILLKELIRKVQDQ